MGRRRKNFDPYKHKFVEEYVKDGNAKRSAQAAGFSAGSSSQNGVYLLRDPYVVEALETARKRAQEKCDYNAEQAMKEANDAIAFAINTGNANAYVKAVELRAKIQGLLVDKIDLKSQVAFSIIMQPLRPQKEQILPTEYTVEQLPAGDPFEGVDDDPFS